MGPRSLLAASDRVMSKRIPGTGEWTPCTVAELYVLPELMARLEFLGVGRL